MSIYQNAKFYGFFSKKGLTFKKNCAIIYQSSKSGCGAAGSALPWGGRGRKFKSCHSDQKSGVVRFPIFLYLSRKSSQNLAFS